MPLSIKKSLNAYEEYSKIDPKDPKKQKEWLGRHWLHVDGSVSKSNCFEKFLSKFCLTRWIFKKLKSIDINKTDKNLSETAKDVVPKKSDFTSLSKKVLQFALSDASNLNQLNSDFQNLFKSVEDIAKIAYVYASFEDYIVNRKSNLSFLLTTNKVQTFEKYISDLKQVRTDLENYKLDSNAFTRLEGIAFQLAK